MIGSKTYIIGNWKSNKNRQEVQEWFDTFAVSKVAKDISPNREVVICPSLLHLEVAKSLVQKHQLPLKLGTQDVSPFVNGAYTGAVSAAMLKDYVEYIIIGHSERRKNFSENESILFEKVKRTKEVGLKIIFCVPDEKTSIPTKVDIIAYEPIWAIGTGKTDTPENANQILGLLKQKNHGIPTIYGGSVTPENIVSFVSENNIDGVLPGGASLDPIKFSQMISAVNTL